MVKGKGKGRGGKGVRKFGKGKGKGKRSTAMSSRKGKGKGKGPKGGCFTCGGQHYASECPGKRSVSELDQQAPKVVPPPNTQGAQHPQPQPIHPQGPPNTHPALAQCNTAFPQPQFFMMITEDNSKYSILNSRLVVILIR